MTRVIIAVLCVMLILMGCAKPAPAPLDEPISLTKFTFSSAGSSVDSIYSYSAEKTSDGTHIHLELNCGQDTVDAAVQEDVLGALGEIAAKHRLDMWNGFDKSNNSVLDGESFSLHMVTSDGQSIYAHGSNAFPAGYSDAMSDIAAIFAPLIEQYEQPAP